MNKWLRAVCVGAAAAAMLTASAFAANYTNCADSLHEMGLFQGTQNGYDLDRTPTRAEAAVMLVRLLGKEAEVKTLTYTAPFTDLKGWEKPYVQYLYSNGLANGTSRTTFNPTGKCTAQMYAVFLLRALGYSDTADFSYANAIETALRHRYHQHAEFSARRCCSGKLHGAVRFTEEQRRHTAGPACQRKRDNRSEREIVSESVFDLRAVPRGNRRYGCSAALLGQQRICVSGGCNS